MDRRWEIAMEAMVVLVLCFIFFKILQAFSLDSPAILFIFLMTGLVGYG